MHSMIELLHRRTSHHLAHPASFLWTNAGGALNPFVLGEQEYTGHFLLDNLFYLEAGLSMGSATPLFPYQPVTVNPGYM